MVKSFIIYKQAVAEQQLIITVSSLMSHLPTPAGIDVAGGERRQQKLKKEKQKFLKQQ
jgi:hypothetical protein